MTMMRLLSPSYADDHANRTVHLQFFGRAPAVPAGELLRGDVVIWNYGMVSRVVDVTARGKSGKACTVHFEPIPGDPACDDQEPHSRNTTIARLFAVSVKRRGSEPTTLNGGALAPPASAQEDFLAWAGA